jgi:hypothetical protein
MGRMSLRKVASLICHQIIIMNIHAFITFRYKAAFQEAFLDIEENESSMYQATLHQKLQALQSLIGVKVISS